MSRRALPAGHPPWRCRNAGLTTSGATNYMRHEAGGVCGGKLPRGVNQ